MNNVIIVIFGSIPKKLVETALDVLGFIALWPPAYYKGRGSKDLALYAVWRCQGDQVASQRSLILLGDSGIIQHICRWHKALNPKYLDFKHSNINQLYWVRVLFSFGYTDYTPKSPGHQS